MIIDYRDNGTFAQLFDLVDIATEQPLPREIGWFYADDDKAIYRCYDRNPVGGVSLRPGTGEIAWTEYYLPIRIVPRPELSPEQAAYARAQIDYSRGV